MTSSDRGHAVPSPDIVQLCGVVVAHRELIVMWHLLGQHANYAELGTECLAPSTTPHEAKAPWSASSINSDSKSPSNRR